LLRGADAMNSFVDSVLYMKTQNTGTPTCKICLTSCLDLPSL